MDIARLEREFTAGTITPLDVIRDVYGRIEQSGVHPVWISLVPRAQAEARARELATQDRTKLPLFGIPFAVKDNIDVAGLPTTAGCPAFAYTPAASATVVTRLEAAGAILIGKTNMDQFATGLVGTRSPYGIPASVFNPEYISGGSSSGSAVAVASGLVSFSLGTDTAGSGRVPAMFNNLVGVKPTRGLVSAHGVVPACRTLDCVSIFAETTGDAARVLAVAGGFDPLDAYSRKPLPGTGAAPWAPSQFGPGSVRVGVLKQADREFFGDPHNGLLYEQAIETLKALGAEVQELNLSPFFAAAALLYQGPWVAERYAAIASFLKHHAAEMDPTVAKIIMGAAGFTAVQAFEAQYKLETLRRDTAVTWEHVDVLLLPTAPRTFTIAEIEAAPIERNSQLGTYTNFVNLLDLAAVAVPAGMRPDGLPFGVSLIAPAFTDTALLSLADKLQRALNTTLGGSNRSLNTTPVLPLPAIPHGCQLMTVVGAHLSGQPLNWQLTSRGGRLLRKCRTHPDYRFYALKNTTPPKPGLVWSPGFAGPGVEVEVWALPADTAGSFVEGVPQPLAIGTLRLEDGTLAQGFLVEPAAVADATEITHFGGWRAYLQSLRS
ncbi:MAG: allophanate hydrolase [Janthinobacterium lividum]